MDVDKLIILANYLDEIGLSKEADIIDTLIDEQKSNDISDGVVSKDSEERIRTIFEE